MKTLLITGGTSGIGEATARHAVAEGHQVYVTGRQRQRLDDFLGSFDADARQRITGDVVDASSWEQTQRAVQACVDHFGGLDVAYANAGFSSRGDLLTGDPDSWRDMINTNFLGAALLIKAALPVLTERRGHFLFTGSVSGRKVYPGNLYTATKWAITGLAESLRQQVIGTGVRVSIIAPGHVDTPLWGETPVAMMQPDDVARVVMWVLKQPEHVDVSEVIVRALGQII
ncbi:SDR family oxidoreductase [Ralstonia insidiosa]|mgnify:CR=1 FL=1|jgi:NADP-dependent 3-hydroxy acid dehydrogenase YdfG|uniref:SDR family oxidoreductase n=2 Tax=Bacteria TaxID=2 RepID=UPI000664C3FC|nr:SDR family oxidoreductase [Ralstonia insidiosa]KMW49172.1 short-chain dehydrogenase [Ralstonia sp. MD27]NOZ19376.1 SDR family oxidoreductase [Betaproteobacteria bacterium]MBA9857751.1 SDR family oxidoreductase [Ralstonia insidiosa]MBA9871278.1 SDR family oxidoreductase [Ralstonia insidiosa]MBA9914670.1 SDR family oxidoreductase [Ralstonia insidiosa]